MLTPLRHLSSILLTTSIAVISSFYSPAQAALPKENIRVIVPFPAGGNTDFIARIVTQQLSSDLGHPIFIENKPGAGGNLGTESVVKASPDGATLLASTLSTYALNAGLYKNLNFDTRKDLEPISLTVLVPLVLVVPSELNIHTLAEFIDLLKNNPGKYNYGSAGNGTSGHIALSLFTKMTNTDAIHIPYKGTAPVINDLLGGHITFTVDAPSVLLPHIQSGKLTPLAVSSPKRLPTLPNVPTFEEAGLVGYEAYSWNAIWAPANTPKETLQTLHDATQKVLSNPDIQEKIDASGVIRFDPLSLEETRDYMKSQYEKWVPIVKDLGISIE